MTRIDNTQALADHLGLSRWTVSRVLNGHEGVRASTRARVEDAMRRLGFAPNPIARSLRGGRTQMIGVCFQEIQAPALHRKTVRLQSLLRDQGYRALLELTGGNAHLEEQVIRDFLHLRVDGMVLIGPLFKADSPSTALLVSSGVPVVVVDANEPVPFPAVSLDRRSAMRMTLNHLHAQGHERFALLGFHQRVPFAKDRFAGLEAGVKRLGLDPARALIPLYEDDAPLQDHRYGRRLAEQLLARENPPRAVIGLSDPIALGALNHLKDSGYSVPQDFAIIGFDNTEAGEIARPALTSVDQQIDQMMGAAVQLLMDAIRPTPTQTSPRLAHVSVRPRLEVRASAGPAGKRGRTDGAGKLPG